MRYSSALASLSPVTLRAESSKPSAIASIPATNTRAYRQCMDNGNNTSRRRFVSAFGFAAGSLVLGACGSASRVGSGTQSERASRSDITPNPTQTNEQDDNVATYLEITLRIDSSNRPNAVGIYQRYKQPFLDQIDGALSKRLLAREEDVQVLHGFESRPQAEAYLTTELFTNDVVRELAPLLAADPEIRVYDVV